MTPWGKIETEIKRMGGMGLKRSKAKDHSQNTSASKGDRENVTT